jgi:hypothetical protein
MVKNLNWFYFTDIFQAIRVHTFEIKSFRLVYMLQEEDMGYTDHMHNNNTNIIIIIIVIKMKSDFSRKCEVHISDGITIILTEAFRYFLQ